jgi:glycerol-3-phosphate acyltransferase PlsY
MIEIGSAVLAVVLAYLLGSLSFAVLVSRAMGLRDPRTYGSHNPGATNVLRSGNKRAALLTLLLDAAKGWLPVWVIGHWGSAWGLGAATLAGVGLAAFLGHLFPVFFRFQGGKGVATAAGVLLALQPWLGLAVILVWIAVALAFRYSSLAAIMAAVLAPLLYWFGDGLLWAVQAPVGFTVAAMSLLLLWRHADNIQRLIAGQESRIGAKKPAARR